MLKLKLFIEEDKKWVEEHEHKPFSGIPLPKHISKERYEEIKKLLKKL